MFSSNNASRNRSVQHSHQLASAEVGDVSSIGSGPPLISDLAVKCDETETLADEDAIYNEL